jgi:hypothetical protein
MDSLWPYLQVKQPYLDCVTTIRVRLQGAFSALGEAVKCMIDQVEDFNEGPDETFGTQDTDAVQVRIRARQPSMYPCLPSSRMGLTGGKACVAARGSSRQGASVIEFGATTNQEAGLSVSRKAHPVPSAFDVINSIPRPWLILNSTGRNPSG